MYISAYVAYECGVLWNHEVARNNAFSFPFHWMNEVMQKKRQNKFDYMYAHFLLLRAFNENNFYFYAIMQLCACKYIYAHA